MVILLVAMARGVLSLFGTKLHVYVGKGSINNLEVASLWLCLFPYKVNDMKTRT